MRENDPKRDAWHSESRFQKVGIEFGKELSATLPAEEPYSANSCQSLTHTPNLCGLILIEISIHAKKVLSAIDI